MRLQRGDPAPGSYWVGASREQLAAAVTARRPQMAVPTENEIKADPMLLATADLQRRLALRRAQRQLLGRVKR